MNYPPGLRKWLELSLNNKSGTLLKQGQQELKLILKAITDENLISKIKWERQLPHIIGDVPSTMQKLKESTLGTPKKSPTKEKTKEKSSRQEVPQPLSLQPQQQPQPLSVYASIPNSMPNPMFHTQQPQQMQHQQQQLFLQPQQQIQFVSYNINNAPQVHHHVAPHPIFAQPLQQAPPPYNPPPPTFAHVAAYGVQKQQPPSQDSRFSQPPEYQAGTSAQFNQSGNQYGEEQAKRRGRWDEPPPSSDSNHERKTAWGPPVTLPLSKNAWDEGKFSQHSQDLDDRGKDDHVERAIANKAEKQLQAMSDAIHEFLESRKGHNLKFKDFSEFYSEYPQFRKTFRLHVDDIIALPNSRLRKDTKLIYLESTKRKKAKLDVGNDEGQAAKLARTTRSGRSENDMQDPTKMAARAARFGNDVKLASGVSTYDKITQDSQRIAAALEEAERLGTEVDWESLVIKGTCTAWEKPFLRLTAPPDPSTVRPEAVLKEALENIRKRLSENGKSSYAWASDQLKSIRQDLRVQHIENEFTVEVYESHARAAIQYGNPDFNEFNQCCTRVHDLYEDGLGQEANKAEFAAYLLLYHVYCKVRYRSPASEVTLSLCRPRSTRDLSDGVAHALAVHIAVSAEDWPRFFRLYETAPNLGKDLLRPLVTYVRMTAMRACCRASRTIPRSYLTQSLKFGSEDELDDLCNRFKLQLTSDKSALDCKGSLAAIHETLSEGSIWV